MSLKTTKLGWSMFAIAVAIAGCKPSASKEEQACANREKWVARVADAMGQEAATKMDDAALAECIEQLKAARTRLSLTDAEYQAHLDCQIAAQTLEESVKCARPGTAGSRTDESEAPAPR